MSTHQHEVSEVTRQLIERDQRGRAKYDTSLDRTDLSLPDWLQHMAEELLDAAGYALAAKQEALRQGDEALADTQRTIIEAAERRGYERGKQDALRQSGEAVEMSPEFTDFARGAIAWVLYHHQGGSSPVGQPLRVALGMGEHDRLGDELIAHAKLCAAWFGWKTDDFHAHRSPPATSGLVEALRAAHAFVSKFTSGNDTSVDVKHVAARSGEAIAQEATRLRDDFILPALAAHDTRGGQ